MATINYSTKEMTAKIVYYGPALCGKTTNLNTIHASLPGRERSEMVSLATKTDRTIFFDFLPIELGQIRGMNLRVQLYTVPGQVFYNATRKLVLKGADGIVFVADSQSARLDANVESMNNLEENLADEGRALAEIPHVLQFNKRDLQNLTRTDELNASLNRHGVPCFESVATQGDGVHDTLRVALKQVLAELNRRYDLDVRVVL